MNCGTRFRLVQAILSVSLLCSALANAQAGDRIVSFDSKLTIARDRTLFVEERFEIENENGYFDSGFHRRLGARPQGPQRAKSGSVLNVRARVDGSDVPARTTQNTDDINIAVIPASAWSRGKHVIELSYTAKHQFLIYDDFEDLNENISGEWPIPVERANVELTFPSGMPEGNSISADTGSSSNFRFDCVRTNLPSGVRFETSHPLAPNERLFISARFSPRGYFFSDFHEDGFCAVLENHPVLYPWIASLIGVGMSTVIGFVLAPLALKAVGRGPAALSRHQIATTTASVATVFSTAFALLFHQVYAAMPGFMLGAIASILISGNPHGGEPFSLIAVALTSNFALYYVIARGIRRLRPSRQIRSA